MNDNSTLIRSCPRCQTEVKLFTLPEGAMTDPAPPKARPVCRQVLPQMRQKGRLLVGWKQVLK